MADLIRRMKANLQRKRGRKKAPHLLNFSFAPDKFVRFLLIELILFYQQKKKKHHYIPRSEYGVQVHKCRLL